MHAICFHTAEDAAIFARIRRLKTRGAYYRADGRDSIVMAYRSLGIGRNAEAA